MRTGERARGRRGAAGFTYVWLLFVLAVGAGVLAAAASSWSGALLREREREQIFRGRQIAEAIGRFRAASPRDAARGPLGLDELVEDRRGATLRRHLRSVYHDPFTGAADWEPLLDEHGHWRGVRSRALGIARLRLNDDPTPPAGKALRLADRAFVAETRAAQSAEAADAKAPSDAARE